MQNQSVKQNTPPTVKLDSLDPHRVSEALELFRASCKDLVNLVIEDYDNMDDEGKMNAADHWRFCQMVNDVHLVIQQNVKL